MTKSSTFDLSKFGKMFMIIFLISPNNIFEEHLPVDIYRIYIHISS